MLSKILLAFSIVSNFATLLGFWMAYAASPATLQQTVGHVLILSGAIASILGYAALVWFVFRPKVGREIKRGASFYEDDPHYTTVRNHTFRNETVELDGKRFENCAFENATILFHGRAPTEMIDPTFTGSLQITTDDPAIKNFMGLSELLRSAPHVAKFDCVVVDEQGHEKQQLSSSRRLKFKPVPRPTDYEEAMSLRNELQRFLASLGQPPEFHPASASNLESGVRQAKLANAFEDRVRHTFEAEYAQRAKLLMHRLAATGQGDAELESALEQRYKTYKTIQRIVDRLNVLVSRLPRQP